MFFEQISLGFWILSLAWHIGTELRIAWIAKVRGHCWCCDAYPPLVRSAMSPKKVRREAPDLVDITVTFTTTMCSPLFATRDATSLELQRRYKKVQQMSDTVSIPLISSRSRFWAHRLTITSRLRPVLQCKEKAQRPACMKNSCLHVGII